MNNNAAVVIGVNEYLYLHPLNYAKQDAQALENFLLEEAGFAANQCVLMTPTSPPLGSHSTYPNQGNLRKRIQDLSAYQLRNLGNLWFYFSGYAAHWNGQDYLLPVEATLADISQTCIPVEDIFNGLRSCDASQYLVLLDIKRPPGFNNAPFGEQTARLAEELEIPLILSCKSRQTSSESPALQHGFFTAALLDALARDDVRTVEHLARFLNKNLPALCEDNNSYRQDPLVVIGAPQVNQQLFPKTSQLPSLLSNSTTPLAVAVGGAGIATAVSEAPASTMIAKSQPEPVLVPPPAISSSKPTPPTPPTPEPEKKSTTPYWLAGLALFLLMIWGLYQLMKFADEQALMRGSSPVATEPVVSDRSAATNYAAETTPASQAKPIAPPTQLKTPTAAKPKTPTVAKPKTPTVAKPLNQPKLLEPNVELETTQAHKFVEAIAQARAVPVNDPRYSLAQKNIDRWSQIVLDIAIGRGQTGNYDMAIKAAKLVPQDRPQMYAEAQRYIAEWQKKLPQPTERKAI